MTLESTFPEVAFAQWLSDRIADGCPVAIRDIQEPAQGFSSRTLLLTAHWIEGGKPRRRALVLRLQRDLDVPMLADVFHQFRVMKAITKSSSVKVPNVEFAEEDPTILGAPFFVMDQIDGRVPSDFPSYHAEGWFASDLDDRQREHHWWNGVKEMHRLHKIEWRTFPFLLGNTGAMPDSRFYLEQFLSRWFAWAADGCPFPLIEDALGFLVANPPPCQQSGLVWNDARLGNTMFRPNGDVASLFDFEVASLGPPEIDLAHWMYLDDVFSLNFGISRITGIPDEQEAIAGFERLYGWPMPYFSYYQAIAALKILILTIRDYSNTKTMASPDALPDFLVSRLRLYLGRYTDYLRS